MMCFCGIVRLEGCSPASFRTCLECGHKLSPQDSHNLCVICLGVAHLDLNCQISKKFNSSILLDCHNWLLKACTGPVHLKRPYRSLIKSRVNPLTKQQGRKRRIKKEWWRDFCFGSFLKSRPLISLLPSLYLGLLTFPCHLGPHLHVAHNSLCLQMPLFTTSQGALAMNRNSPGFCHLGLFLPFLWDLQGLFGVLHF